MQEEKSLVSVVIPTYRDRGNLKRAIDSVLAQTYPNIEVIIVDDNNPTDCWRTSTQTLMNEYKEDERVHYIKHALNKNGAAARNTGIKNSKGKYIAFLDDDDYFKPSKIEIQVALLENDLEFQAAYCQCERNGKVIAKNLPYGNLGKDILLLKTNLFTPSLIFRAESIKHINGFDESFKRHQDYEMMIRFFAEGFRINVAQEALTVIGTNSGENRPDAESMEALKKQFLNKFDPYMDNFSKNDRLYRNKVYARNYSGVFLSYVKAFRFIDALRIMLKYSWRYPSYFFMPLIDTVVYHISKK